MGMRWHGIRNRETKVALGVTAESNDGGEFCVSVAFKFVEDSFFPCNVWLVDSRDKAERALRNNTEWYNAGWEAPMHGYVKMDTMEIFEVEI